MADARLRVCLTRGEFEVEGTEAFVAKYADLVKELTLKLKNAPITHVAVNLATHDRQPSHASGAKATELPAFGEVLHALPTNVSGTDQMLLPGTMPSDGTRIVLSLRMMPAACSSSRESNCRTPPSL